LKLKGKNNNNSLNILLNNKEYINKVGAVGDGRGSAGDGSVVEPSDYNEYGVHKNVIKFINIQSKKS
jgi:hypothetical protein